MDTVLLRHVCWYLLKYVNSFITVYFVNHSLPLCSCLLLIFFCHVSFHVLSLRLHIRCLLLQSGLYSNFKKPLVRIDPDLRCAAMLVYGCQLIIFPFKKDAAADGSAVRYGSYPNPPCLIMYRRVLIICC